MEPSNQRIEFLKTLGAVVFVLVGLYFAVNGCVLGMQNPRSNEEDGIAWCIWALGMSLIGGGVSLRWMRPIYVIPAALLTPPIGFAALVCLYWGVMIISALLSFATSRMQF